MHRLYPPAAAAVFALAVLLLPAPASAQSLSIAPKIGTGGLGGDIALGLTDRLTVRGGVGFVPVEFEDVAIDDNEFDLTTPDFFATVGADLKLVGPLRLMGGLLFRSGDFEYSTEVEGEINIGDETYMEDGTLSGRWESRATAPFVGIGLGHAAGAGFGFFMDVGVAFTGDPEVTAEVTGDLANAPGVQQQLETERQRINDDIPDYAEYWPIVQFGFRIGIGN